MLLLLQLQTALAVAAQVSILYRYQNAQTGLTQYVASCPCPAPFGGDGSAGSPIVGPVSGNANAKPVGMSANSGSDTGSGAQSVGQQAGAISVITLVQPVSTTTILSTYVSIYVSIGLTFSATLTNTAISTILTTVTSTVTVPASTTSGGAGIAPGQSSSSQPSFGNSTSITSTPSTTISISSSSSLSQTSSGPSSVSSSSSSSAGASVLDQAFCQSYLGTTTITVVGSSTLSTAQTDTVTATSVDSSIVLIEDVSTTSTTTTSPVSTPETLSVVPSSTITTTQDSVRGVTSTTVSSTRTDIFISSTLPGIAQFTQVGTIYGLENQLCRVAAGNTRTVLYGVSFSGFSTFATQTFTTDFSCTYQAFPTDVAPGVDKTCFLLAEPTLGPLVKRGVERRQATSSDLSAACSAIATRQTVFVTIVSTTTETSEVTQTSVSTVIATRLLTTIVGTSTVVLTITSSSTTTIGGLTTTTATDTDTISITPSASLLQVVSSTTINVGQTTTIIATQPQCTGSFYVIMHQQTDPDPAINAGASGEFSLFVPRRQGVANNDLYLNESPGLPMRLLANGQLAFANQLTSPIGAYSPSNGNYFIGINHADQTNNIFCTMDVNNRIDCALDSLTGNALYFRSEDEVVGTGSYIDGYTVPNADDVTADTAWLLQAVCP